MAAMLNYTKAPIFSLTLDFERANVGFVARSKDIAFATIVDVLNQKTVNDAFWEAVEHCQKRGMLIDGDGVIPLEEFRPTEKGGTLTVLFTPENPTLH